MKILIIGGSHAGVTAALHLKQVNPTIQVTIIEKNIFHSFIASGINMVAKRIVKSLNDAQLYHKKDILAKDIEIMEQTEVVKLSKHHKQLTVFHLNTKVKEELTYDYLILATGSHQNHLTFHFEEDPRFISYKSLNESKKSYPILQEAKHVAIIGAGFIGLELADWLDEKKKVTVIERMERPYFRYFDDGFLKEIMPKNKTYLSFRFNNAITKVTEDEDKLSLHLLNGEIIEGVDCVVSAINGLPNTGLFEDFIELNFDKTVAINKYLQTSLPYVYAVGDIIGQPLVNNTMKNNRYFLPLVSNALRSAHVAAQNILTANSLPFEASNRTIVTVFGPYYLGSSGMNELDLLTHTIPTETFTKTFGVVKEDPHPSGNQIYAKIRLTYHKETRVLLGCQMITTDPCLVEDINMVSVMIHTKLTLDKIAQMDFFFQPELKPFQNILQQVALEILIEETTHKKIDQ